MDMQRCVPYTLSIVFCGDRLATMKPIFAIATIMNATLSVILTRLKQELADLYGDRLLHLTLFGSQARGDAEVGSDIDVLVVLKPPVNPGAEIKRTGKVVANLSLHYDVVIGCLFMDETHYQTRNGSLLRNIRKEGILL
ncbi:MAG TPA: nucleotidyltransferase domain-containing protein [Elainellaceae cyanobacterium]